MIVPTPPHHIVLLQLTGHQMLSRYTLSKLNAVGIYLCLVLSSAGFVGLLLLELCIPGFSHDGVKMVFILFCIRSDICSRSESRRGPGTTTYAGQVLRETGTECGFSIRERGMNSARLVPCISQATISCVAGSLRVGSAICCDGGNSMIRGVRL